jgi:uncharacterized protein
VQRLLEYYLQNYWQPVYCMDDASDFEWDADKAAANWQRHGVLFQEAINAFRDTFAVEIIDERMDYGEERINLIGIGMCNGVILHVTYTERSDRIRLISARRAEKHEQDHYYSQNAQEWDDR